VSGHASSFWSRRILNPILAQMRRGISSDEIALTVALGLVLAIFPILGTTTALCACAALAFRLNQPIIQLVNYAAYPLQLALLIPFYRVGETLFGRPHIPLSIPLLIDQFKANVPRFIEDFGLIALGGIAAWLLVAPIVVAAVFYVLRPSLRSLARKRLH
jgi:uncharacterized protein (DUF2062 family)